MKRSIEELLDTPYWIIDILPMQVAANSKGQYFAVEKYYLEEKRFAEIKKKHIDLILKLNCYRDIFIDEETGANPSPERTAEEMRKRHLCLMVDDSMIVSEPDATYLTLFDPDKKLLELVKTLTAGEGLYLWQPPQ